MSKYQKENKANFSDYNSLNTYCKGLGIPYLAQGGAGGSGGSGPAKPFQAVPVFTGFNYETMPYNSLNANARGGDSAVNNYATINQAYLDTENNGGKPNVTYVRRACPNC